MSNSKDYFILISYPKESSQSNEILIKDKKILVQNIYSDKKEKNKDNNVIVLKYAFNALRKSAKTDPKKNNEVNQVTKTEKTKDKAILEFISNKITYKIEFELDNKTFIYQPKLKKVDAFYKREKIVEQNIISNSEKFNIFYSALTKETGKEEEFSSFDKDSINLYDKEPTFEFLINIFVKIFNNLKYVRCFSKNLKIF